ncbi:MAG: class I SAM-dependent methyltransferase [Anaerolineales bacterium]|nr:class I SAM-dependent methyltransferase [Anaerolineales bacterium]
MIYLSPRPDHKLRTAFTQDSVPQELLPYTQNPANYFAVTNQRTTIFLKRLRQLESIYGPVEKNAHPKVLDVGASAGTFVKLAGDQGWLAFGIEPSWSGTREALRKGLDIPIAVAEKLPFPDETFDLVHSHHVFEHLANPMDAAQEAWRVLKPGGVIFIEVPNQFDNIMFRRDMLFRRVPQRQRNIRSIHHLWFFGRSTLQRLLIQAGFQKVQVHDFFGGPLVGWRIPFTVVTRLIGQLVYGGDFLNAWGWKPG